MLQNCNFVKQENKCNIKKSSSCMKKQLFISIEKIMCTIFSYMAEMIFTTSLNVLYSEETKHAEI